MYVQLRNHNVTGLNLKPHVNAPNSINTNINSTKFLGLTLDISLSWKDHIAALTSKLNKACYAIRSMKPLLSTDILRMICFSYAHSVMSYGIIFWGNKHSNKNIFKIQKRIIRIIANIGNHESCRQAFKELQILTLPLQFIFSLLIFVNKIREIFYKNSEIHDCNTHFKDIYIYPHQD